MKLNKHSIVAIERQFISDGAADRIVFDEDIAGFGLRLRKGGKRVWIVQYKIGVQQRRMTLGSTSKLKPEEAREEARKKLASVTLNGDPQADKVALRTKVTLGAVLDAYLDAKRSRLRPKSFEETERYLRKHWRSLHGLPIHRIERRNIAAVLGKIIADSGPISAARARAAMSGLFAWAVGEGYADQNMVIGTHKPDQDTKPRERVLTDDELAAVWKAAGDEDYGRIIKVLILTGQRRDEVGAMGWSEFDREQGKWIIPGARTKNKRDHEITLPSSAWAIIDKVEPRHNIDCLFGLREHGFSGWSRAKASLDERAQLDTPWVVHDLRRTVATRMADLGVLPHVIEAVLGHVSGHRAGVAGIYNRSSYEREVRAALALWADHVRSLIEGTDPKIVPIIAPRRA